MNEKRTSIKRPKKTGTEEEQIDLNKGTEGSGGGGGGDVLTRVMELEQEQKAKRKKIILKVIIGIVVIAVLGVGYYYLSTGLNDKRVVTLNAEVAGLEGTVEAKNQEIVQLNAEIEDTTVREVVPITSLQRVEGSKVPELHLIEGDFIAPNALVVPGTIEDVNDTYIQVGSKFRFKPSEGWVVGVRGSTLELGHPEKIWGKVKAVTQNESVHADDIKNVIQSFFVGYPATTITYRRVYIEDRAVGMTGTADVPIKMEDGESKIMRINIGIAQRSGFGVQYIFIHDIDGTVSQELIDLFLQTGVYGNQSNIKIE